ncbi:MAG: EAL domain-containing protein [Gammaproteobacteria bacterium]|nr:EAL domain-containing protein [Gammaproteobacteria bacterium]
MSELQPNYDKSYRYIIFSLIFVSLAVLSVMVMLVITNNIITIRKQLSGSAQLIFQNTQESLHASEHVLDAYLAYFSTVGIVDYRKLEEYSRAIRKEHPFIHSTQYMIRVQHSELEDFLNERERDGYADFRVTEYDHDEFRKLVPVAERGIYYPIVFIDPMDIPSLPLLGFDVLSFPSISDAVEKSINTGKPRASKPFNFHTGESGYTIVTPIYTTNDLPRETIQRYDLATRLVAVAVKTDNILDSLAISENQSLSYSYFDADSRTYSLSRTINPHAIDRESHFPVYSSSYTLDVAGQSYEIELMQQMTWADLNYKWLALAFSVTAGFMLLSFNFVNLRIRSAKERQRAQAEIFREREHAQVTLHSISEAVITTDVEKEIVYMNPIARRITGWNEEEAIGMPINTVFRLIHEDTREPTNSTVDQCLETNSTVSFDDPALLINKNGDEFTVENSSSPIRGHNGEVIGAVLVFKNITHIRNLSKKMEFQATHDSLTGLVNRHEFEHQLKIAVNSARDDNRQHAICYLDLDQFKIVNDTCGHIAGDQLLKEIAALMPHNIRASDCLARLGGDEFGVLMFDCPIKQAAKVAENLRATIRDFTFCWDKKTFDVGVSIGLVPIQNDSGSVQDVLRRSDSACYIAKDLGRNRVHLYTPDDIEISRRHGETQWVTRIKKALEQNHFQLYLQAVKPISGTLADTHYEVLVRMLDETGDAIPPMSFIPAAERYDLMPALDRWVISSTFQLIGTQQSSRRSAPIYNINLSGQTLSNKDILEFIREELDNHAIDASRICFEITETAVIANLSLAIDFIGRMKQMGCMFALDDFGSGLSSFAYLKKLPVDFLKIDGEFVRDIIDDPMDRAIVSAINDIGHEIGLTTVAEYVENEDILTLLKELGVDYAQGYGVDKPKLWRPDNVVPLTAHKSGSA